MSTDAYNIKPAQVYIYLKKGDNIIMAFNYTLNGSAFTDLAEGAVKMQIRDFRGNLKTTWQSDGDTPDITLSENKLTITADPLGYSGSYKYDIQYTDSNGIVETIQEGLAIISNSETE